MVGRGAHGILYTKHLEIVWPMVNFHLQLLRRRCTSISARSSLASSSELLSSIFFAKKPMVINVIMSSKFPETRNSPRHPGKHRNWGLVWLNHKHIPIKHFLSGIGMRCPTSDQMWQLWRRESVCGSLLIRWAGCALRYNRNSLRL